MQSIMKGAIIVMCLTFPVPVRSEIREKPTVQQSGIRAFGVPPDASEECKAYLKERRRHDRIRVRADNLCKNPRLSGFQDHAASLRAEDDRMMEELEVLTSSAGGYVAALARLKRHNDKLLRMVRRAQNFAGD